MILKDSSFLPGELVSADEKTVVFNWMGETELRIPTAIVARVLFRTITAPAAARLQARPHGVLTREGDFVDGEPLGVINAQLKLSSVVFGVMSMDTKSEVLAAIYREAQPGPSALIVRTLGGGILRGSTARLDLKTGKIVIEQSLIGPLFVSPTELISIETGTIQ